MQRLLVFQSLWGMQCLRGRAETSLEAKLDAIADAGFDGVTEHFHERAAVERLVPLLRERGLDVEGQVFPTSVEELAPALELAREFGVHHLTVQADVRPRAYADSLRLLEGWMRLADEAGVPVYFETHRGRLTNDLLQMLDLLRDLPALRLTADLSHYVVAREFPFPVPAEMQAQVGELLRRAWAIHGRVASPGQVQVEISFAQHRPLLEQFVAWWQALMRDWRGRAGPDDSLAFTCELGPRPYAISGPDGEDLSDRWQEALQLKDIARQAWARA
jgi:hypothetical protein